MSRYIDADNLHNAKFQNTDGYGENVAYRVGWNEAIEAIEENEPTAIDIVRCKECASYCGDGNKCLWGLLTGDMGYCHHGYRGGDCIAK